MPFPSNVALCTIVCEFLTTDGFPMAGKVSFTPAPTELIDADTNQVITSTPAIATLDLLGNISIQIPASDSPNIAPNNFSYTVVEALYDPRVTTGTNPAASFTNTYNIFAPGNATINLSDVMPVVDYTGDAWYRGPAGPQGPPGTGGDTSLTAPAGQNLSGQRVVRTDSSGQFVYASNTAPADVGKQLFLTTGAALIGDNAIAVPLGYIYELGWSWAEGPIYLGVNGVLTQTPPTSGFIVQVAASDGPHALFFNPRVPLVMV